MRRLRFSSVSGLPRPAILPPRRALRRRASAWAGSCGPPLRRLDNIQGDSEAAIQELLYLSEPRSRRRRPHPIIPLDKKVDQLVAVRFDTGGQRAAAVGRPAARQLVALHTRR